MREEKLCGERNAREILSMETSVSLDIRGAKKRRRFNADVIIFRFFCFYIPRRACYEACKPEGSPVIIPPYPPHRITIPECNPCPLLPTGALPFYFRHTSRFGQPYFTDISALLQPYFHRWKYVRTAEVRLK